MRVAGKSYKAIMELLEALENKADCVVATIYPEQYKQQFKRITGKELELTKTGDNFYTATLKKLNNYGSK